MNQIIQDKGSKVWSKTFENLKSKHPRGIIAKKQTHLGLLITIPFSQGLKSRAVAQFNKIRQ